MSKEHIDEINALLVEHAEALTAFYDEGIEVGKRGGFIDGAIIGIPVGVVITGITAIYTICKRRKQKEIEV